MKALFVLAGIGAAAILLFGKKKNASPSTVQIHVPTTATSPASTVTINQSATTALPGLSVDETVSIESDSKDDLYRKAMASKNKNYVDAAALLLAMQGDTRAADLTLRVANWGT